MSTLSPHPSASALVGGGDRPAPASAAPADAALARAPLADGPLAGGPVYLGLTPAAWIKIGVLTLLMVALYRFNLARLWAKTNPFNGQGNWEHAIFIPLVGLYYLYVWREPLLARRPVATVAGPVTSAATATPVPLDYRNPAAGASASSLPTPTAENWTLPGIWAFAHAIPAVALLVGLTFLLPDQYATDPVVALLDLLRSPAFPAAVAGVVVASAAAAAYVYLRRDELKYPKTQLWLTNVWHGLGCWTMAYAVAAGTLFFVGVATSGPWVTGVRLALGTAFLMAAGGIFWKRVDAAWRWRYDRLLAGSSGWFGAFVLLWGITFSLYGVWPGQNDFCKDIGMVVSLFGLVLLTTDWRVMAVAWFPVVYLFCALPWPDQTYSNLAMPLQMLAAKVGVFVLQVTGVEAGQTGTKIWFYDAKHVPQVLNVEEACAGLKSLMTFVSIGAAIAFLSGRLLWQKLVIAFMAVPTAILCNTGRISGQGLLHRYVSEEWSHDFAHGFVGLVLIFPGFGLIWLSAWVVDHLFIEESDEKPTAKKAATVVARAKPAAAAAAVPLATAPVVATVAVTATPAVTAPSARTATPTTAAAVPPAAKVPAKPAVVAGRPAGAAPANATPATRAAPAPAVAAKPAASKSIPPVAAPASSVPPDSPASSAAVVPATTAPAARPAGSPAARPVGSAQPAAARPATTVRPTQAGVPTQAAPPATGVRPAPTAATAPATRPVAAVSSNLASAARPAAPPAGLPPVAKRPAPAAPKSTPSAVPAVNPAPAVPQPTEARS